MCSRYTLTKTTDDLADLLEVPIPSGLVPRFNIAPTQGVAAVRVGDQGREFVTLQWGLVPSWADDLKIATRLLNARSETVAEKPSFRAAYRRRRCILPADGFFEWQTVGKKKLPFLFHRAQRKPFLFAGLWERRERIGEEPLETCTILTTTANATVSPLHDRMPVILSKEGAKEWLVADTPDPTWPERLLIPAPDDYFIAERVSDVVNNSRNEGPRCIEPVKTDLFGDPI